MQKSFFTFALIGAVALYGFFGLASLPQQSVAAESVEWMTDFKSAQAKAQSEGKPLLLDFTGSDWCGWCIRLKKEVFSQPEFAEYAESALVLVELDFPRSKPLSDAEKEQNEALAKKYGIRGYPTIILLSPEGKLVGRTGYQPGGAEKYVSHLKELLASGG
ncbi:thioredoxin family protein [Coraliomargarita parva]|uniref:thioredoxin family protein n=1 Tax=Coraliomargarita parva TaxID=3014050 RepID=UPI0022B4C037|nr:thioredoxin family protein [Coraliomargarita parva]